MDGYQKDGEIPCVKCDMISFNLWFISVLVAAGLGALITAVIILR